MDKLFKIKCGTFYINQAKRTGGVGQVMEFLPNKTLIQTPEPQEGKKEGGKEGGKERRRKERRKE
jgi:hypothetical protein